MDQISSFLLIFHFLLLIPCSHGGIRGREADNILRLHGMDGNHHHHHHDMTIHGHTSHMDPLVRSFFLVQNLKADHKIYTYISQEDISKSSKFLPRDEAESIPFTLEDLPDLLTRFNIASGSPQARDMRDTLTTCHTKPIRTETNFCPTSLESMLDFVRAIFGPTEPLFQAISTTRSYSRSTAVIPQNYTVLGEPVEVPAPKMVGCHTMSYPYAVFYCHSSVTAVKVFKVKLVGEEDSDDVDAVAVCHMDTSEWSPSHVSFRVLGIEPGRSPVCHFFPVGHLVWVPKLA